MQMHEIILVVTVLVCLVLHLRRVVPSHRASRRLEAAVRQRGDSFVGGMGWQFQMFRNSKAIFCETDTPDIRALKQEFYDRWHHSLKGLPVTVGVALGGFALSALVCWIELFLRRQP
ncbi:MAG: hypothetical protein P4M10_02090 [Verrucomicrobiae bacterium]|nr:hypothetical protein [Verrucomicrobiae bacterium]